jgi:hypothetical protein
MTCSTICRAVRLALLTSLVATAAPQSSAQSSTSSAAEPSHRDTTLHIWKDPAIATVILVDTLPDPDARAVIIRRPGNMPNNIILVTRSTLPAELSMAVTALAFSRRNRGDEVDREMRTMIRASLPAAGARPTADDRRAEADLRRLRAAPEFLISGIARGPAIVVRMSDRAVSGKGASTPPGA